MPWSQKTYNLAQAIAHGFKPTGSAKGFSKKFARQVIREGVKGKKRKKNLAEALS